MAELVHVAMAQMAAAAEPALIETQALGSCVGIVFYDAKAKVGGIVHAMLPSTEMAKKESKSNPAKFVSTAVPLLVMEMEKLGAHRANIKAKLVGGANMFPTIVQQSETVGERNIAAARNVLEENGIPLIAESVGGSVGRTVTMDTATGRVKVRSILHGIEEI